jgi:hypothetical protein
MSEAIEDKTNIKPPTMLDALIPIIALVIILVSAVYLYGDEAVAGRSRSP